MMLFSIIISVYNGERYLNECFDSVSTQSFRDYELIVIDDGSTDTSGMIADRYATNHPYMHVIHTPNQGLLLARREGLAAAHGEYVMFLDADDMLRSDALAEIASAINENGADIVAFRFSHDANFSAPSDSSIAPGIYKGNRYRQVKKFVCEGRSNNLCGKAMRRSCMDLDADYTVYRGLMHGEDLLQLPPVIDRAHSFVQLDDALYYYRPNDLQSTALYKSSQLADIVRVNRRLLRYAQKWDDFCPRAAYMGETLQYVYLFKISELSSASRAEKRHNFAEIRAAMHHENAFARAHQTKLRPDNRIIVRFLEHGWYWLADAVVHMVEVAKGPRN